jgi:hypothetical protein
MGRDELLERVRRLGAEFRRRGMEEHLRPLRVYYLALRAGLTQGKLDVSWSPEHTRMWMQALRLAPFEDALPIRPVRADCPRCGGAPKGVSEARPAALRRLPFPGGARVECLGCKDVWLEEAPG